MKTLKEVGDWSEQTSSSGKRYYYNRSSEVSQWEKPEIWKDEERKLEELERLQQKKPSFSYTNNARQPPIVHGTQAYQGGYMASHPPPPPPPTTTTINLHTVTTHPYTNPYGPGPIAPQLPFPIVPQHIVASNSSPKTHSGPFHPSSSGFNNKERDVVKDHRQDRDKERDRDHGLRKRPYPRNSPREREKEKDRERERDRENRDFHQKERERDRENFRELNSNSHLLTPHRNAGNNLTHMEANDSSTNAFYYENNKNVKMRMDERPKYPDEKPVPKTPRTSVGDHGVKHLNGSTLKHSSSNDMDVDNRDTDGGSVPMDIEEEHTESNNSIQEEIALPGTSELLKNFRKKFPPPYAPQKDKQPMAEDDRDMQQELLDDKKLFLENGKLMLKLYQTQALSQMCRVKAEVLSIRLKCNREVQRWIESRRMGNTTVFSTSTSSSNNAVLTTSGPNNDLGPSNVMSPRRFID